MGVWPNLPSISCLMATQVHRLEHFRRSVAAYSDQTYPNRELVVLIDLAPDHALKAFRRAAEECGAPHVRVEVAPQTTLGVKRNTLLDLAGGELVMQWDDDDLYHPTRIQAQFDCLSASGADAVYLMEVFQLLTTPGELYWTNFRNTPQGCHAGTVLMRRGLEARYPEQGEQAMRGEDTEFLFALKKRYRVEMLAGAPFLYVYLSHGANTWSAEHHQMLAHRLGLSRGMLLRREAEIRAWLTPFTLGPKPIVVMGPNGPAFTLT
jgi:glycosyltransferase involved in cell wall biosynthesis